MKRVIVTGGNKNVTDAMGTLAVNINTVIPHIADELIILHDGISISNQAAFNKIMPTRFIKYSCPVSRLKLLLNPVIRYFSPMVFSKIECFRLLNEYDEVIWLDYDMLLKGDISEILKFEKECYFIINHDVKLSKMLRGNYEKTSLGTEYNLDSPSMVASLFLLRKNNNLDYNKLCDWYYKMLEQYSRYLYLPEQALITMMLQEFDISYDEIDEGIYNVFPTDDNEKALILHCYGQKKFWSGMYNETWDGYYRRWIAAKE